MKHKLHHPPGGGPGLHLPAMGESGIYAPKVHGDRAVFLFWQAAK